jgi:hypothetical protein
MLHVSTSDWTQARGYDGLLLEKLYDWAGDYCIFMSRFGSPRHLARGMRFLSQLRRDLIEIAVLGRKISTLL